MEIDAQALYVAGHENSRREVQHMSCTELRNWTLASTRGPDVGDGALWLCGYGDAILDELIRRDEMPSLIGSDGRRWA